MFVNGSFALRKIYATAYRISKRAAGPIRTQWFVNLFMLDPALLLGEGKGGVTAGDDAGNKDDDPSTDDGLGGAVADGTGTEDDSETVVLGIGGVRLAARLWLGG